VQDRSPVADPHVERHAPGGAITRASEDQWQLADRNLRAERVEVVALQRADRFLHGVITESYVLVTQ
jgi:hypothetical protein